MLKVCVGIDPGQSGGIAVIRKKTRKVLELINNSKHPVENADNIREINEKYNIVGVVIEKIGARPAQGLVSTCTFCKNNGVLLGALTALEIPTEEVHPRTWQVGVNIPGKKRTESKPDFKKRLVATAQQMFPKVKKGITLRTADALLMAEYCRRTLE